MLQFTGAHIVLEDDRRTDLVDQRLILTGFLPQAPCQHSLMSQHRGEAFIEILDRNLGHRLAPAVHKLLYTRQILTRLTIGLTGFTNHEALYGFLRHILRKIFKQL